jgi:hypothetical protein
MKSSSGPPNNSMEPTAQKNAGDLRPATCGKSSSRYYLSAGREAHLEAVRRLGLTPFDSDLRGIEASTIL